MAINIPFLAKKKKPELKDIPSPNMMENVTAPEEADIPEAPQKRKAMPLMPQRKTMAELEKAMPLAPEPKKAYEPELELPKIPEPRKAIPAQGAKKGAAQKEAAMKEAESQETETEYIEPSETLLEGPSQKSEFYIDLRPKLVKIPDTFKKEKVNIRYPLLPPFAYAHVYWNTQLNELVYDLEEPPMDATERELLQLIQLGLEEMINVSFVKTKKISYILNYLERNVQSILVELGARISRKTYQKIMYYIYRNSIGLNEIEPMMNDYYIEDLECNGARSNVYVVHRRFGNLRTNLAYTSIHDLTNFVEKLAQKSGRYVSYAKPLLDGTLPDGSRVNATYTQDVTTKGPTFTIRKFTKQPWTPIHLIEFNTASAEVFAYMWLAIEHKFNVIMIGETGCGKTTFLNAVVNFIPPEARVCSIEDTRELNLAHENWLPAVTRTGFGIPNLIGGQYGEVTLFDLLRETFRQNPDYVIVGEVRGEETYVLFQGMASGHPSFSTFHAASIAALVRRLSTPPINLSPSLIESLNIVCIFKHIKTPEKSIRRLVELDEIIRVRDATAGDIETNALFTWEPVADKIKRGKESETFRRISKDTGIPIKKLEQELVIRTKLLLKMKEKGITGFKEVNETINQYYKEPETVLRKFGIRRAETLKQAYAKVKKAGKKAKPVKTKKAGKKTKK